MCAELDFYPVRGSLIIFNCLVIVSASSDAKLISKASWLFYELFEAQSLSDFDKSTPFLSNYLSNR